MDKKDVIEVGECDEEEEEDMASPISCFITYSNCSYI